MPYHCLHAHGQFICLTHFLTLLLPQLLNPFMSQDGIGVSIDCIDSLFPAFTDVVEYLSDCTFIVSLIEALSTRSNLGNTCFLCLGGWFKC